MTLSIRHKLAGLSFLMILAISFGLTMFFSTREVRGARRDLAAKGATYAQLLSRETEPAVAFDDAQSAREVLEATALDTDVRSVALYASTDGHVIASVGEAAPPPEHDITDVETRTTKDAITSVAPVVSREGPTGVLVLEMSLARVTAARRQALVTSLSAGAAALGVGLCGAWFLGVALSARLRKVQRASREVARGDLSTPPVMDDSGDEIGLLARDFNAMTTALRAQVATIEETAHREKERLDALVLARTEELTRKNRDMRLVFDNANQGFLTLNARGEVSGERSRVLETWFGAMEDGAKLADVLERHERGKGAALGVALDALFEDLLPRELLEEQLPKHARVDGRHLSLEYRVLDDEGAPQVLVMISDATDEVLRRDVEAAQRDLSALCARIVAGDPAVSEFIAEADALRKHIESQRARSVADVALLRSIHTLKGNAALLGLSQLAEACHALETELSLDEPTAEREEAFARVVSLCRELDSRAHVLLGAKSVGVSLTLEEVSTLASAVVSGMPRAEIARFVQRLKLEPVAPRLRRTADQATALAERLGKHIDVRVEANGVRLDAGRWAPFWAALVHVVRNAVDHGVETPEARARAGKAERACIVLRAIETATHHVVEVQDDGPGVDFDALTARARAMGSHASGMDLLFMDGLSSRDVVTEVSGRGVGLGAARAACVALGGSVFVETRPGQGTKFRFAVPMRGLSQGSLPPVRISVAPGRTRNYEFD